MKMFKKVLASCAVLSTVVALGAVAYAEDVPAVAYDATAGTVTFSGITDYLGTVTGDTTMLVLSGANADITTVTDTMIKQIEQDTAANVVGTAIPVGTLADGTYTVRVGGASTGFKYAEFTVSSTPTTHDVLIGDANGDSEITTGDATEVMKKCLYLTSTIGDEGTDNYIAAMLCNGLTDTEITTGDFTEIMKYCVYISTDTVGTKHSVANTQ